MIQELDGRVSADRAFSFRHEFADQWYDLHHPEQTATPMTVRFDVRRQDFPSNLESIRIEHLALYFARKDGSTATQNREEIAVERIQFEPTTPGSVEEFFGKGAMTVDGIISTRKGNGAGWNALQGLRPFGTWELALQDTPAMTAQFRSGQFENILLVITYGARTPDWD